MTASDSLPPTVQDDAPPGDAPSADAVEAADAAGAVGTPSGTEKPKGRNLWVATPVALGLIAVFVASLWFSLWPFVSLVVLALTMATWELRHALAQGGINLPFLPLAVGGAGTQVAAAWAGVPGAVVGFFATVAAALAWRLFEGGYGRRPAALARDLEATVFAAIYLPLLASFVTLTAFMDRGKWFVMLLVALPVASDTFGFFVGSALGRHPMAPTVSPKKSWEGMAGSVVGAVIAGVGGLWLLHEPWYMGLALGVAGAAAGTLGDLAESLLKRSLGLKDMGTLLPGHGGVLDRVDSILMTAPLAFIVLTLLERGVFG
ncbi:MAG: phosphatidate cytidylyltransferase [Bifidobacteriaceae bacterium]|jgi:phosphatidate cytidylyltransferase|nr:phosphatidate cytidylyltransferase [Bifidobacteriaceae bacterium]